MFVPEKDAGSSSLFQTDVRRRTNLSTATNALRSAAVEAQNDSLGLSSEERLAEIEDEMNRIVDRDVETLVEGMEEIVDLSSVRMTRPSSFPQYLCRCSSSIFLSFFWYRLNRSINFAHYKIV